MSKVDTFFDTLSSHYKKQLPFVVYSRPINNIIKCWLQNDDRIITTENFSESGFVFTPFDLEKSSILFPTEHCDFQSIEISPDESLIQNNTSKKSQSTEVLKIQHIQLIEKALEFINHNKFSKVVLSRNETILLKNTDPIELFKRLFHTYKQAMVYCWFHPKVGLWLGATPELLFKTEGQDLTTISLAGTQLAEKDKQPYWAKKEFEEQQIVTDYLINQTSPLTLKTQISDTESIKAGQLWHLKTRIKSRLKPEVNLKEIIKILHPTPAVCGFPKDITKDFILNNENYLREFYTGFLGELNLKSTTQRNLNRKNIEQNAYDLVKKNSNFYVNLRCMQIKNNKALIYVGGGITKDSIPENEWDETCNKLKTMMRILD